MGQGRKGRDEERVLETKKRRTCKNKDNSWVRCGRPSRLDSGK